MISPSSTSSELTHASQSMSYSRIRHTQEACRACTPVTSKCKSPGCLLFTVMHTCLCYIHTFLLQYRLAVCLEASKTYSPSSYYNPVGLCCPTKRHYTSHRGSLQPICLPRCPRNMCSSDPPGRVPRRIPYTSSCGPLAPAKTKHPGCLPPGATCQLPRAHGKTMLPKNK